MVVLWAVLMVVKWVEKMDVRRVEYLVDSRDVMLAESWVAQTAEMKAD